MLRNTLYLRLLECVKKKDVTSTRNVHLCLLNYCQDSISTLGGYLIRALTTSTATLFEANLAFSSVSKPCVFTWNAIILAHTIFGEDFIALDLYTQMMGDGLQPNDATLSWVVKICGGVGALLEGMLLHQQVVENGSEMNVIVGNSLVDMYAKCGRLEEARNVFDKLPGKTVVSWGAMFSGYAQQGEGQTALELFKKMLLCYHDVEPNAFIYSCLLKGCSNTHLIEQGKLVHKNAVISSFDVHEVVGGSIVDMYAKCGNLEDAHKVFQALPHKNVVLWGALMTGFVEHGHSLHTIDLFFEMQEKGITPSRATFLCVLKACSDVGVFEVGMLLHDHILRMGLHHEVAIGTLLIEMYAKCGKLKEAQRVFDKLPPNSVAWGTLIAGYAHVNNYSCEQYLETMQQEGVKPNDLTYSSLLSSYSHAGTSEEGCLSFKHMMETHGISPSIEHYNCLVDLLGRTGSLEESKYLLHTMPFLPDFVGWTALLANCHSHGNVTLAKGLFNHALES